MEMDSTAEDFIELERLYADHPAAYRRRVLGLVCLGYGYIAFCLLVISGFLVGGVALIVSGVLPLGLVDNFLKVAIPAVVLAGLMLRAFFVRIPAPEGTYLTGALKAKVLAFVEPIREAAQGRPVKEVVIVNELNAAVQQQARFGLFGPTTNYLILGAPLLQVMSPTELKAVLAHEFGHLSHEHGRMGATVYRLDNTLRQAAQAIHEKARTGLAQLSFKFFDWFYPKFNRVTFAMRRGQEYEADRVASRATSPEAMASALCRIHTLGPSWSEFWEQIWKRARTTGNNSEIFPQRELASRMASLVDARATDASVQAALSEETNYSDTHPCLRDRLAGLGEDPVTAFAASEGALAEIFDEAERQELFALLDAVWHEESGENWQQKHEGYRSAEQGMEALQARRDDLAEDELFQLARMEEGLSGREASVPTYRALVERFPESASAHFHWARLHIESDLALAEGALRACLDRDIELVPEASQLLRYGFEQAGREDEPESLAPYQSRYQETVEQANAERDSVTTDDRIVAHDLADDQLEHLRQQLSAYPEIRKFHLAEKSLETLQHHKVYVLAFTINSFHDNVEVKEEKWLERVMDQVAAALPGPSTPFGVVLKAKSPWIPTFDALENSLVYEVQQTLGQRIWSGTKVVYSLLMLAVVVGALGYLAYTFFTR